MKNSTIAIILVGIVLLVGGGAYFLSQKESGQNVPVTTPADSISQTEQVVPTQTSQTNTSRYVEYVKDELDNASTKRRVLFFYASWCPTCRPADESFRANESSIPEDVVVIRVNYNDPQTDPDEKELAKKYGITYQHTYVQIDEQGNQIAKWNGGQIEELLKNVK